MPEKKDLLGKYMEISSREIRVRSLSVEVLKNKWTVLNQDEDDVQDSISPEAGLNSVSIFNFNGKSILDLNRRRAFANGLKTEKYDNPFN